MYVWDIEFQDHYSNMEKCEWDEQLTSDWRVVAPDYESALSTAKSLACRTWEDEETGEAVTIDDVRLLSIDKGTHIDAVATGVAA